MSLIAEVKFNAIVLKCDIKLYTLKKTVVICNITLAGEGETSVKSRTFVFKEGGHTIGNALRCIIARYSDVVFCGYTVPHPSEKNMHFRIQTTGPPAIDVLRRGIEDLEKLCNHTLSVFQEEMKNYKEQKT